MTGDFLEAMFSSNFKQVNDLRYEMKNLKALLKT